MVAGYLTAYGDVLAARAEEGADESFEQRVAV
jgi:hypothetical protein